MKKIFTFIVGALFLFLTTCSESKHDEALKRLDGLATEVSTCTNQEEFDMVYEKIIVVQHDENFKAYQRQTQEQKTEIVKGITDLTLRALAAKAILYVKSVEIQLTKNDMKTLIEQCMQKKLNTTVPPYKEVKTLVEEYYQK